MTDFGVEVNRFMERFYIESRAVDLESLCIVAGEQVFINYKSFGCNCFTVITLVSKECSSKSTCIVT